VARKRNVETEARIAAAATELFSTQGYVDTTMAAIAREAGGAVQTLYLRHGSKAAILSAALDVAIAGDTEAESIMARGWFARALEEADAVAALSTFGQGVRSICDRTHRLYEVIRSAAADPEVAEVLDKNRQERISGLRVLAEAFVAKPGFARDVPVERAADLLYALGTEDSYLLFVLDRGWTADAWQQWVVETLTAQLLVPAPAAARRRRP
jgi:AcrR family transcriptional regulator